MNSVIKEEPEFDTTEQSQHYMLNKNEINLSSYKNSSRRDPPSINEQSYGITD